MTLMWFCDRHLSFHNMTWNSCLNTHTHTHILYHDTLGGRAVLPTQRATEAERRTEWKMGLIIWRVISSGSIDLSLSCTHLHTHSFCLSFFLFFLFSYDFISACRKTKAHSNETQASLLYTTNHSADKMTAFSVTCSLNMVADSGSIADFLVKINKLVMITFTEDKRSALLYCLFFLPYCTFIVSKVCGSPRLSEVFILVFYGDSLNMWQ